MRVISKNILFLTFILSNITACSPVSSNWSCKSGFVSSCKTIKEIDSGGNVEEVSADEFKFDSKVVSNDNSNQPDTNDISFNSFRSKESVARVKFSPYVDEAGNRHDYSVVYYLENKAEWRK